VFTKPEDDAALKAWLAFCVTLVLMVIVCGGLHLLNQLFKGC